MNHLILLFKKTTHPSSYTLCPLSMCGGASLHRVKAGNTAWVGHHPSECTHTPFTLILIPRGNWELSVDLYIHIGQFPPFVEEMGDMQTMQMLTFACWNFVFFRMNHAEKHANSTPKDHDFNKGPSTVLPLQKKKLFVLCVVLVLITILQMSWQYCSCVAWVTLWRPLPSFSLSYLPSVKCGESYNWCHAGQI